MAIETYEFVLPPQAHVCSDLSCGSHILCSACVLLQDNRHWLDTGQLKRLDLFDPLNFLFPIEHQTKKGT